MFSDPTALGPCHRADEPWHLVPILSERARQVKRGSAASTSSHWQVSAKACTTPMRWGLYADVGPLGRAETFWAL